MPPFTTVHLLLPPTQRETLGPGHQLPSLITMTCHSVLLGCWGQLRHPQEAPVRERQIGEGTGEKVTPHTATGPHLATSGPPLDAGVWEGPPTPQGSGRG